MKIEDSRDRRATGRRALVLGGERSGKSRWAERLAGDWAEQRGAELVYIATAQPGDAEMAARIDTHRARRGPEWRLIETPRGLGDALANAAAANRVVLVDCLTLWLTNELLFRETPDGRVSFSEDSDYVQEFYAALETAAGDVICVSNEVGMALTPMTSLGRAFVDAQGRLNQGAARIADLVAFIAAGLPLMLKGDLN